MLSRIADSLYWMNRYMERADGLLRIAGTHYILGMDKEVTGNATWKPVLQLFTAVQGKELAQLETNTEETLKRILLEPTNDNSLKLMVNRARENARGAQDHITKEVWEQINQMYHLVNQPALLHKLSTYQALDVMKELTRHTVLYAGTIDITMPRGSGWYFMSLGRYVERCLQTIVLTEKQLSLMQFGDSEANDILQWRHLLLSLSGYELHLKTYRSANHNFNVLHQIVANENFTRSIVYTLRRMDHYLNRVTANQKSEGTDLLLCSLGRLYSKVRYVSPDVLNHLTISTFLADVKGELFSFNKQLEQHFFSYS